LSCATGLTPENSGGGSATASITAPSNNNLAQVVYSGTGGTSGGSLTCTATDTQSNTATYTVNLAAVGSVSWTLQ
ncbi:MAG: hypothetical protein ACYDDQ_13735, partial [Vulcanimicrobiaceae bacterium]